MTAWTLTDWLLFALVLVSVGAVCMMAVRYSRAVDRTIRLLPDGSRDTGGDV